jgi:hypothetical protein
MLFPFSLPSDTNRVDGSHLESYAYRLYFDLAASILQNDVRTLKKMVRSLFFIYNDIFEIIKILS